MQERRKSLIANATFQLRWMLQAVLVCIIFINVILIVAFYASSDGLSSPDNRLAVGAAVAIAEVIGLALVFWFARRHSNRIAGPVYRMQKVATAMSQGDLTQSARIREGDFFAEEFASLEDAVEALRARITSAQEAAAGIEDGQAVARLREELNWFKTGQ